LVLEGKHFYQKFEKKKEEEENQYQIERDCSTPCFGSSQIAPPKA